MAATRSDISAWFDTGVALGATHMVVMCDDFDFEDYPVYVALEPEADEVGDFAKPTEKEGIYRVVTRVPDVRDFVRSKSKNMQRVMEVYSLSLDKNTQIGEFRAFHYE